jgi:uncharacterized membrane protein
MVTNEERTEMNTTPQSKRALRGIGSVIFFAALSIVLSGATQEFWGENSWLQWLFQNYGIYAGVAGLIFFTAVVYERVKKGERINADLNLILTIISLIVAILALLVPDSVRNQWYQSITGPSH